MAQLTAFPNFFETKLELDPKWEQIVYLIGPSEM